MKRNLKNLEYKETQVFAPRHSQPNLKDKSLDISSISSSSCEQQT